MGLAAIAYDASEDITTSGFAKPSVLGIASQYYFLSFYFDLIAQFIKLVLTQFRKKCSEERLSKFLYICISVIKTVSVWTHIIYLIQKMPQHEIMIRD